MCMVKHEAKSRNEKANSKILFSENRRFIALGIRNHKPGNNSGNNRNPETRRHGTNVFRYRKAGIQMFQKS